MYKGLDIITNKPTLSTEGSSQGSGVMNPQRSLVNNIKMNDSVLPNLPHHLINHYDPLNPVSSTVFAHEARKVIKDILNRNKTPILEGGSPFYM